MKSLRQLCLLFIALGVCNALSAQSVRISLCDLQKNPEQYLGSKVQVEAYAFAGIENPHLTKDECSFRYAVGNDYQSFGNRFPVKDDREWTLLHELLGKSECASNIRVAKAKITGTVIRIPATGTTPPNEMPFELVLQSVTEVGRVSVKCTPLK